MNVRFNDEVNYAVAAVEAVFFKAECPDPYPGTYIVSLNAGIGGGEFAPMLTARAVMDDFGSLVLVREWL